MGQKSALGDANGNIIAYYDDKISPAPATATNLADITDAQWLDSVSNPGKYQVINSVFGLTPAPTQAQLDAAAWLAYQDQARAALADTDTTMHRIGEGVALATTSWTAADVVAFVNYRRSLRAILSQAQPATIPASLPAKPPYPAGT